MATVRKGDYFRRRGDGFLFVAKSTTRKNGGGAFLQCTEATAICGWFWMDALERGFDRLTPSEYRNEKEKRTEEEWTRCTIICTLDDGHEGPCRTEGT